MLNLRGAYRWYLFRGGLASYTSPQLLAQSEALSWRDVKTTHDEPTPVVYWVRAPAWRKEHATTASPWHAKPARARRAQKAWQRATTKPSRAFLTRALHRRHALLTRALHRRTQGEAGGPNTRTADATTSALRRSDLCGDAVVNWTPSRPNELTSNATGWGFVDPGVQHNAVMTGALRTCADCVVGVLLLAC